MFRLSSTIALAATAVALTPALAGAQVPGGSGSPTGPPPPTSSPPPAAEQTPPPVIAPAPPPPPQPQPAPQPPAPKLKAAQVDPAKLAAEIRKLAAGNAFGWQFAIAQDGTFATSDAGGSSRSNADTPGPFTQVMTPTTRYELASLTKNVTAVATMKLLRIHGLTIKSPINSYLPKSWQLGMGFKTKSVTFEQLLTHTSGLNQVWAALPADERKLWGNSDAGLRYAVKTGTTPNSQRSYKNANYALLRVLNARMWAKSGAKVFKGDTFVSVNKDHAAYAMDFYRKQILGPSGIGNVTCQSNTTTVGLNYSAGSTQTSTGREMSWPSDQCAGNAGLRLSSTEVVRYLAHLRHGAIIDPDDLATLDAIRGGWAEDSDGGDGGQFGKPDNVLSPGVFWHGGALLDTNKVDSLLDTCGMTFSDGTEAAMITNSPIKVDGSATSSCGVLIRAWAALHPKP